MQHNPRFLKLIEQVRQQINELSIQQVKAMLDAGESFHLLDVREVDEWQRGHLPQAAYLGKGVLERDIEKRVPDVDARIVCYCGGGYRSALTAENLQRMGYRNVYSMDGGFRAWREAGLPIVKDEP